MRLFRTTLTTLLTLCASCAFTFSLTAQGASFDCGKGKSKVEHIICDNPEISNLDDGLAAVYKATLQAQAQPELVIQAQKKWLKARNDCKDAGCVKKAYMSRLAVLEGVTEATLDRRKQDANRFGDIGKTGYEFKLEVSNNDKVCNHMSVVYSQYFNHPFAASSKPEDYAEGGQNALPMLPGVQRDSRLSTETRRSLQPSSPEFDAVKWQEGRIKYPQEYIGEQPTVVTNIDIDNDGSIETVIKISFMQGYLPSHGSMLGGEDSLFIFRNGDIELNPQPLDNRVFYDGWKGHRPPAEIAGYANQFSGRLIRIFAYEGVNYLSAYSQAWLEEDLGNPYQMPDKEYMEVLQYRSGGDNLGKGKWSQLKIDTICKFRMTAAK